MGQQQFLSEIRKVAEEVAAREGCLLYDVEFVGAPGGRALRIFIDKEIDKENEGGASIEDCANVSRELNQILDVREELVPGGNYHLEVSTPGLERVLKEPRHFERAIGKKISVKSMAPLVQFNEHLPELDKAKQVQGILLSFDEHGLKVAFDDGSKSSLAEGGFDQPKQKEVFIPFDSVTKAHVVFDFSDASDGKKPKSGSKKMKRKDEKKDEK